MSDWCFLWTAWSTVVRVFLKSRDLELSSTPAMTVWCFLGSTASLKIRASVPFFEYKPAMSFLKVILLLGEASRFVTVFTWLYCLTWIPAIYVEP